MVDGRPSLLEVLEESRSLGFLGPGQVQPQIQHAQTYVQPLIGRKRVLDLGSGGGLPGLVLAIELPQVQFVLLDAHKRRCAFLQRAIDRMGLTEQVAVVHGRAEVLAHSIELRKTFDAVVARSFGAPATTAECAVGFLDGEGAVLVVSEPPSSGATLEQLERWPDSGLKRLGLRRGERIIGSSTLQVLEVVDECEDHLPRRNGVPAKRPMFHVERE